MASVSCGTFHTLVTTKVSLFAPFISVLFSVVLLLFLPRVDLLLLWQLGGLWAFGGGLHGKLGVGSEENSLVPLEVRFTHSGKPMPGVTQVSPRPLVPIPFV